jgi:2-amino-4-hydroxy-6-hydroxymethyldihydropteridine diphosphokinase
MDALASGVSPDDTPLQPHEAVIVALGANLGDPVAAMARARTEITCWPELVEVQASGLYRTAPFEASGPDFFNAALRLVMKRGQHGLSPASLLDRLQAIELAHGRERPYVNAPRTLDLDILFCGMRRWDTPRLTLPHPRLHERAFAVFPLLDVWPEAALPEGPSLAGLRDALAGQGIQACVDPRW